MSLGTLRSHAHLVRRARWLVLILLNLAIALVLLRMVLSCAPPQPLDASATADLTVQSTFSTEVQIWIVIGASPTRRLGHVTPYSHPHFALYPRDYPDGLLRLLVFAPATTQYLVIDPVPVTGVPLVLDITPQGGWVHPITGAAVSRT